MTLHRATLAQPVVAPAQAERQPAAELLEDPHTDLGAIAAWLATPHQAGIWLSRADIVDIGRRCGAPAGFGPRRQLLENLLSSAAIYGELPRVARELMRLWQERDRALGESGVEPALLEGWSVAAADAGWLLARMGQAAQRGGAAGLRLLDIEVAGPAAGPV